MRMHSGFYSTLLTCDRIILARSRFHSRRARSRLSSALITRSCHACLQSLQEFYSLQIWVRPISRNPKSAWTSTYTQQRLQVQVKRQFCNTIVRCSSISRSTKVMALFSRQKALWEKLRFPTLQHTSCQHTWQQNLPAKNSPCISATLKLAFGQGSTRWPTKLQSRTLIKVTHSSC